MREISKTLTENVINLLLQKDRKTARKLLETELGIKKTQAYDYIRKIEKGIARVTPESIKNNKPVEIQLLPSKYHYDPATETYTFPANKNGDSLSLSKEKLKEFIRAYSNFDGNGVTIKHISRDFGISREDAQKVLKAIEFTHDELPILNEEYTSKEEAELVERLLLEKRRAVNDKFNQAFWDDVKRKAELWEAVESGIKEPFQKVISSWKAPSYKTVEKPSFNDLFKTINEIRTGRTDHHYVIGLSDLHFGAYADERHLWFKKNWNISMTQDVISRYLQKVKQDVANKRYRLGKAYVLGLGDILHSLSGFTDKGTKLEVYPLREEQFERALDSLTLFLQGMVDIFGEVEVHAVQGNHDSIGDWLVFKALECYFRTDPHITFNITNKRYNVFKIKDSLVLFEHGYSALYKARLPQAGKARESYVQTVLMQKPEMLVGAKAKYFITADLHHFESKEYNDFEHIMFSTPIGGDRHSDNCGLNSRPRQNVLVFNKEGLKETVHIYF